MLVFSIAIHGMFLLVAHANAVQPRLLRNPGTLGSAALDLNTDAAGIEARRAMEEQLELLGGDLILSFSHSYPPSFSFSFSYGADPTSVERPGVDDTNLPATVIDNEDGNSIDDTTGSEREDGASSDDLSGETGESSSNWGSETELPPEEVIQIALPSDSAEATEKKQSGDAANNAADGEAENETEGESNQGNPDEASSVQTWADGKSDELSGGLVALFTGAAAVSLAAVVLMMMRILKKRTPPGGSDAASSALDSDASFSTVP